MSALPANAKPDLLEARAAVHTLIRHGHQEGADAVHVLCALYEAQSLELQAVREALAYYGRHNNGCLADRPPHSIDPYPCTCGFDAAPKQSRGAT